MAARCESGWAQRTMPESYGTFSHLCASVVHESARSRPATRCRSRGETAAQMPNAPSMCSHAPAEGCAGLVGVDVRERGPAIEALDVVRRNLGRPAEEIAQLAQAFILAST